VHSPTRGIIIFRAPTGVPSNGKKTPPLRYAPHLRTPRFLEYPRHNYLAWWESLHLLFTREETRSERHAVYFISPSPLKNRGLGRRPLILSVFLHCLLALYLADLTFASSARIMAADSHSPGVERIYYKVPLKDWQQLLPRIAPRGAGGRSGDAARRLGLPPQGNTVAHRTLTIISKPVRPDNPRQTIYQPASPPDLRMKDDLKLPNIITGNPALVPRPKFSSIRMLQSP